MKLIIGIGNPGTRYFHTRHNLGFRILDQFCLIHKLKFQSTKSNFWEVESIFNTFHFFLIKPATYVNNSGIVVKELADELNVIPEDILVVYDDTNINVGEVRIRKSGSDGGHNGIKSIIYHLEADNFIRLRVGIGATENNDELADYVLSPFPECDIEIIEDKLPFIIKLLENFITGGVDLMLNYYSKESNIDTSNIS